MFTSPGDRAGRKRFLGLQFWIESRSADLPNVTVPAIAWSPNDTAGTVDTAVVPKGTGAFLAAIPDNVVLGGNKRGNYSVDLQLRRNTNNMVAGADYCALIAGRNNFITTSLSPLYSGIFVGFNNSIAGGAAASAQGSVILGGTNNTINDSSGGLGAVQVGGNGNTITVGSGKDNQVIVGSISSLASGVSAIVLGGREHSSVADNGVTLGYQAKTRACIGSLAHGCNAGSPGSSQFARYVLQTQTNDAVTSTPLTQAGGSATSVNQPGPIPTGFVFSILGLVTANTGPGVSGGSWRIEGAVRNNAGTLSVCTGSTVTNTSLDAGLAGSTVLLTVDAVNNCIRVNVTGIAGANVRWGGWIETMER